MRVEQTASNYTRDEFSGHRRGIELALPPGTFVRTGRRHGVPDFPFSANTTVRSDAPRTDCERSAWASRPAVVVVEFSASLDMSSVDHFRHAYNAVLEEVTADGFTDGDLIVLDLSRIDFVSIDATSALVEAKDRACDRGFEFKLVTATRGVDHALAATGAAQLLMCHPTVESAVGSDPIGQMS